MNEDSAKEREYAMWVEQARELGLDLPWWNPQDRVNARRVRDFLLGKCDDVPVTARESEAAS